MNTSLLKKVATAMAKRPMNVVMETWLSHADYASDCGTVGCIAGWAVAQADIKKLRELEKYHVNEATGRKVLGLSEAKARRLFYIDRWPREFYDAYTQADTRRKRAEAVIDRVKHFIKYRR